MSDQELNREWAVSQLEAWADGSLTGAQRERMRAALERDPGLRAAAERAVAVYRTLREQSAAPLPKGPATSNRKESGGAIRALPR